MTNDMTPPPHDSMEEAQMTARWWPQEAEPATVRIAAPAGAQAARAAIASLDEHIIYRLRAWNGYILPKDGAHPPVHSVELADTLTALTEKAAHADDVIAKAVETQEWLARLTAQARHAEDCLDAAKARIEELRSDRDCEKRLRKDAEDARDELAEKAAHADDVIAVAIFREAEMAALTERTRHAECAADVARAQARHAEDCLEAAKARIAELEAKNAR